MDVIDWIFYGIGRLTQMGLNGLGVPIRDMSDGGYTTLGLFTFIGVCFLVLIFWAI